MASSPLVRAMPIASLRAFPPPLRLDVEALARLHTDGRLELLGPAFPPEGALALVLWRPGERPAFRLRAVTLRAGRVAPGESAWVVAWRPLAELREEA